VSHTEESSGPVCEAFAGKQIKDPGRLRVPGPHAAQLRAPLDGAAVLAGHREQLAAPAALEKLPSSQSAQLGAPGRLLAAPGAQGAQAAAPLARNSPTLQHTGAPAALDFPGAHAAHAEMLDAPGEALDVFAGHGRQEEVFGRE
jgi:hypothetical protein